MVDPFISDYWGKACTESVPEFHPAVYHLLDVAAVAAELLRTRPDMRRQCDRILPGLTSVIPLIAALHDIGKFTRPFQAQRFDLLTRLWPGAKKPLTLPPRHSDLGALLWGDCTPVQSILKARLPDWTDNALQSVLQPSFGHHGWPPRDIADSHYAEDMLRDGSSADLVGLVAGLCDLLAPDQPPAAPSLQQARSAGWLTGGVVILADWIGSNTDWFPYHAPDLSLAEYWITAQGRAKRAVRAAGLTAPVAAAYPGFMALTGIAHPPSSLQSACETVPLGEGPQIIVIEDATGSGKTEAALVLASRLLHAGLAGRVFIGLPTQATANAMFGRLGRMYRALFTDQIDPGLGLAHGRAGLHAGFRQAQLAGAQPEAATGATVNGEEPASILANAWLADNRKKALLADVGVGTIDQALLGVVKARHQGLRLLGVSGAVLVIDEVHAYDAYTGRLLEALLEFHAALGGTAILLSATLPDGLRHAFVAAFAKGCGQTVPTAPLAPPAPYPLMTHWHETAVAPVQMVLSTAGRPMRRLQCVRLDSPEAAVALLRQAAAEGRCACWIRNTISDVRAGHALLAEHIPSDHLHMFHAAFIPADRMRHENRVLSLFGKESGPAERSGQILIASQVVEQSLDLDFDVMVSDLAPMDLLIQRAGRLHRHGHRPPDRPPPVLHILGPEAVPEPTGDWYAAMFPRATYVYPVTGRLWLTQDWLTGSRARAGGWDLLADARTLIEGVYGPQAEADVPEGLRSSMLDGEGMKYAHQTMAATVSLSPSSAFNAGQGRWDDDLIARTRLGEDRIALALGIEDAGRILPLAGYGPNGDCVNEGDARFAERRAWAESEVSVPVRLIDAAMLLPSDLSEAGAALRLRLRWPENRPVLVILRPDEDGWTGEARKGDVSVTIHYSAQTGLRIG